MNLFQDQINSDSHDKTTFMIHTGNFHSFHMNQANSSSSSQSSSPPSLSSSSSTSSSCSSSSMNGNLSNNNHNNHQGNPFIGRSQCVVCGDRARGCNFGAITCASCKEFFRRNAFKSNKLKCYFQSKCEINIYSRRFCAACRLSKCYQMGMKNEFIMTDAEKNERNLKIIERKLHANNNTKINFGDNSFSVINNSDYYHHIPNFGTDNPNRNNKNIMVYGVPQSPFSDYDFSLDDSKLIQNNYDNSNNSNSSIYYHNQLNQTMINDQSSQSMDRSLIDEFKSTTNNDSSHCEEYFEFTNNSTTRGITPNHMNQMSSNNNFEMEKVAKNHHSYHQQNSYHLENEETVIKLLKKVKIIRDSDYSVNKFHLLLLAKDMSRQLSEHGCCKLKYLTSIVQILSAETVSDLPTDRKFIDLISIAEIVLFNFIKMCKKLYAFQALSQEDQVALVKGGVMDTLMIWSMMTINLEKECWEALDLERNFRFSLRMEMLKEANPKLYEKHRSYVMSFESEWRYDDNLMSLLIAIALFNPERPDLGNVEMIKNERNAYCNLLKLYLSTLYEEPTSNKTYHRLMNQLKLTEKISEYHVKTYFDLSANEATRKGFGGLKMEIFDLNH